eukprot:gnl/MRDRNA2_/MRDRNA2_60205_c0_seq1.p1 gnl/MRDRNA2_/MRDRNA2_60205_c0~~gnl/MRDRNA2_/MRDRNA2_60205_c0_seq1.p1  ORF type:complete len:241 (-),score=41.41 gnl/MRDRNA2_/MRDRNA2_60205_c0_seq1:17-739(-)
MSRHCVFGINPPAGQTPSARLLVYGDSLTAGFPEYEPYAKALVSACCKAGRAIEIVGCGACGLTARNMVQHLSSRGFDDHCGRSGVGLQKLLDDESQDEGSFGYVLIMAGTNDVLSTDTEGEGPSANQILSDIQMLHRACKDRGTETVVLSIPGISCELSTYQRDLRTWINDELRNWVNGESQIGGSKPALFVDCDKVLPNNAETRAQGAWEDDGLHFSEEGSSRFGEGLAPLLLPLLGH